MENWTVKINCEFIESVEANNESEARQLALRMLNLSLGETVHCIADSDIKICRSPGQEKPK